MATNVIIVIRQQLFYIISVTATLPYQLLPYKVGRIFFATVTLTFCGFGFELLHEQVD
jgi:hypothetical protein